MESEYDIPLEDYNIPYVTIDEMKELLSLRKNQGDDDQYEELQFDEESGLYYTKFFVHYSGDLLQEHLLVEQCLEHLEELDWQRITRGYDHDIISRITHIMENPLVWVDEMPDELAEKFVVTGRVAVEKSSEERATCIPYCDLGINLNKERLNWFANKLPTYKDLNSPFYAYDFPKDMILWDRILTDPYEKFCADLYAPQKSNPFTGHVFWPYCNPVHFRQEIERIHIDFGPQKAAQIVRLLREDWQDIKVLKLFGIDQLTPEQIEEFRASLFEGMDRSLRRWDSEASSDTPSDSPAPVPVCRYIDLDKLASTGIHTPEQFTTMLRQACEQDAPSLAAFLRRYLKLGYLDFHGENKKRIYEHLKECFPGTLNYSYTNFTMYFT